MQNNHWATNSFGFARIEFAITSNFNATLCSLLFFLCSLLPLLPLWAAPLPPAGLLFPGALLPLRFTATSSRETAPPEAFWRRPLEGLAATVILGRLKLTLHSARPLVTRRPAAKWPARHHHHHAHTCQKKAPSFWPANGQWVCKLAPNRRQFRAWLGRTCHCVRRWANGARCVRCVLGAHWTRTRRACKAYERETVCGAKMLHRLTCGSRLAPFLHCLSLGRRAKLKLANKQTNEETSPILAPCKIPNTRPKVRSELARFCGARSPQAKQHCIQPASPLSTAAT